MKRLLWLLAGVFVLAVAVLALLPASLAVSALSVVPAANALRLDDVRGSLWRGSVSRLFWAEHELGALAWQVHPLALLRGRVDAELVLTGAVNARTRLQRNWSSLRLHDLQAELPAAWLDPVLASPGLRPQGDLQLQIAQLEVRDQALSALSGELLWRHASLSGAAVAALGDLRATFEQAEDGRVHGQVHDDDGPLSIQGGFVLDSQHYRAELRLRARDARIEPAMRWLGQAQPDGSRLLLLQGTIVQGAHP